MGRPGGDRAELKNWPIRRKLLAMVLLPLLVVLPLLGVLLLVWGNAALDRLLVTKVRSDMAVAHGYFERMLAQVGASTGAVADSHALSLALHGGRDAATRPAALRALLERMRQREALDFIQLRGPDGRIVASDWAVGGAALPWLEPAPGRPQASVEVLAPDQQAGLGQPLRERVSVPLLPTQNAAPTSRGAEDRAMVATASAAVHDDDGRVLGHVQAGVLLNRNLPFIDKLNDIVYPEGSLPWGSQGTATLFLDDVRISTNVRLFGGEGRERAIGTRVSGSVREAVLGRGATWLGRAFVVSDWYVSGYEPITDRLGRRVGMLYVGFLERPFTWLKYGVLATIGAIFFAVMIAASIVSLRWARGIFRPLEQMSGTMQRVEAGEAKARVGRVDSHDEIGELAAHFDHLLDTLDDQTEALKRWNAELDAKVAERTQALEAAQRQLVRAEKLAAVGQLTAGVAHEVNNPIAVIQGNLDLLRELLGPQAATVSAELKLIDQQIERMRLIVTQLLQFARPTEYAGYVETLAPGEVLEGCLLLVAHLLASSRISIRREYAATLTVGFNRHELQQVLVNLLVNAIQAMPEGGELTLATRDWPDARGVDITVADSGAGLPDELLAQLFQPFVTRKPDGTGLGLWISQSLVERYGGEIRAANRPEGGALITVALRVEPATDSAGAA
ncbi:sensor histidine kinase [Ideonella sp.]|uniref:sensor histidine kinase n=1 Tax=Ideonella sp. TaxID=1929293 RepID=UPI002B467B10|nr:cache domain-containing protein [Ideonella sp.]HJV71893.1 cache domain-containing protein [Ideonella sp.]